MKIYLASRYSRRAELRGYRDRLSALGHKVTSRWLDADHQNSDWRTTMADNSSDCAAELRGKFAAEDLADVRAAQVLIAFTEPPESGHSRGGRHVELGVALGLDRRVYVVGHRENIFCWSDEVSFRETFDEVLSELGKCFCGEPAHFVTGFCKDCIEHAY